MENGKILYEFSRSPMCDYMINFLTKLSNLPEAYMMNTVLENFSILQVSGRWEKDGEGEKEREDEGKEKT